MGMRRYFEDGYAYFLTTKTYKNIHIFANQKYSKILLVTIEYYKLVLEYKIYGYCIMPDHVHLLIHPCGKYNPAYIMNMVKGSFSRKYNKMNNTQGKVWQKSYYDKMVQDEKAVLNFLEYMHYNPVKGGIVYSPEEYEFTSFNHYVGSNKKDIIEIDTYPQP